MRSATKGLNKDLGYLVRAYQTEYGLPQLQQRARYDRAGSLRVDGEVGNNKKYRVRYFPALRLASRKQFVRVANAPWFDSAREAQAFARGYLHLHIAGAR